jgi:ATP-dependent Lon protease
VRKEAEREMARLEKMPAMQPEHSVIRTSLEYVLELRWKKRISGSSRTTPSAVRLDNLDLKRTREVLDEDH